jgi:hypothetical protein
MKGATFSESTDSLEALRNRGDAAWTTATGFSTLTTADVRTAVGLGSANLDTQLAAIVADTNELQVDWTDGGRLDLILDSILVDTGTDGVVVAPASKTGYALSATGTDLVMVDGKTLVQALRIIASTTAGKVSGAGTGTETFLGLDKSTPRATITVDNDGNRSDVTYG